MRLIAIEEASSIPELRTQYPGVEDLGTVPVTRDFAQHVLERLPDITELRLPEMDRYGVDMQVLSLTVPGIQADLGSDDAVDAARFANDYLARVVAQHPTRFAGFAAVPLQDPEAAV